MKQFPGSEFLGYVEKEDPLEYYGLLEDNGCEDEDYSLQLNNGKDTEDLRTILEQFKGCKVKIKIEVE